MWDNVTGWLAAAFIGALVTYFFSTKNLEAKIRAMMKEHLKEHTDTDHKETFSQALSTAYSLVDKEIGRHRTECGARIEEQFDGLYNRIRNIELNQAKSNTILFSLSYSVNQIAKKLNIAIAPMTPPNFNDDNSNNEG